MPNALKVKQFGLPRWVWLTALAGGIGVGLYVRAKRSTTTDTTSADPTAADGSYGNTAADQGGVPVGFYDAVSGGANLPDVAGADTVNPFDYAGFMEGLAGLGVGVDGQGAPQAVTKVIKKGIPGPRGKKGKPGKPGKPGKHVGGGGPPKRKNPKVKAKPKAPSVFHLAPKPAPKPKPKAPVKAGGGGKKRK